MSPEIISAIAAAIAAISGSIVWGIRMLFKKLAEFLSELKPNGGSSIKDQVTRLESQHEKLDKKVDNLYNLLIDHFGRK
jgi:chaperonin cofactor prefoldin